MATKKENKWHSAHVGYVVGLGVAVTMFFINTVVQGNAAREAKLHNLETRVAVLETRCNAKPTSQSAVP